MEDEACQFCGCVDEFIDYGCGEVQCPGCLAFFDLCEYITEEPEG